VFAIADINVMQKFVDTPGFVWDHSAMNYEAAKKGALKQIQWAFTKGCKLVKRAWLQGAVQGERLEMIRYLHTLSPISMRQVAILACKYKKSKVFRSCKGQISLDVLLYEGMRSDFESEVMHLLETHYIDIDSSIITKAIQSAQCNTLVALIRKAETGIKITSKITKDRLYVIIKAFLETPIKYDLIAQFIQNMFKLCDWFVWCLDKALEEKYLKMIDFIYGNMEAREKYNIYGPLIIQKNLNTTDFKTVKYFIEKFGNLSTNIWQLVNTKSEREWCLLNKVFDPSTPSSTHPFWTSEMHRIISTNQGALITVNIDTMLNRTLTMQEKALYNWDFIKNDDDQTIKALKVCYFGGKCQSKNMKHTLVVRRITTPKRWKDCIDIIVPCLEQYELDEAFDIMKVFSFNQSDFADWLAHMTLAPRLYELLYMLHLQKVCRFDNIFEYTTEFLDESVALMTKHIASTKN
jgi:hypothetical protein